MSTVQFEPKIATELPIDWRRASSQASDMFADLLKQRFAEDHPAPTARRRPAAADAMSGRPPRLVLAHPRTLRAEAKDVEDAGASLADQRPCQAEEGCAQPADEAAVTDEGADDAETAVPQDSSDAAALETDAERAALAQTADPEAPTTDPEAMVVVATQPAEPAADVPTQEVTEITFVPASPDEQATAPEQAETEPNAAPGESEPASDAAMEQQAVEAARQAGRAGGAVTPDGGDAAPVVDGEMPVARTQPEAAPTATADEPLPETPQAPDPVVELAPPAAAHPRPDRTSMDIKIRQGSPRAQPAAVTDPKPAPAGAQAAPPHQPVALPPAASGEFGGHGDMPEHPLSPHGSGPGWTLHLAQGAASRRADFVAQLRQHLQNLPAHEQVAVHMQRAARDGTGRFSIQLSPVELGRIHVKMEIDEERRVTAAVTVERPSTLELLQRDIRGLERALHNVGLTMEGGDLSFSLGRGSDQDLAQELGQSAAPAADGTVLEDAVQGDQPAGPVAEVMDTAAGVVNLQV